MPERPLRQENRLWAVADRSRTWGRNILTNFGKHEGGRITFRLSPYRTWIWIRFLDGWKSHSAKPECKPGLPNLVCKLHLYYSRISDTNSNNLECHFGGQNLHSDFPNGRMNAQNSILADPNGCLETQTAILTSPNRHLETQTSILPDPNRRMNAQISILTSRIEV